MNFKKTTSVLLVTLLCFCKTLYAEERIISGTIKCTAEWNELCEDKKILSVPEHYRRCHEKILVAEKTGDASFQVVASDASSITIYFRAKGNQNRTKPQGANIQLNIDLLGVKETETCEGESAQEAAAQETPPQETLFLEPLPTQPPVATATPSPPPPPTSAASSTALHACACSQYLNWVKVENCLAKEKRNDRPPCDSYETTIQCVASRDECRAIQKENCPQVVGLNQSTSFKRIFIENSPYCRQ